MSPKVRRQKDETLIVCVPPSAAHQYVEISIRSKQRVRKVKYDPKPHVSGSLEKNANL